MDRVGRIVELRDGRALIEVSGGGGCSTEGCASCHSGPARGTALEARWAGGGRIGDRVKVVPLDGVRRAVRWGAFLVAFCAVLDAAVRLSPAARGEGPAGRLAVLAALAAGTIAAVALRLAQRGRPACRAVPLERAPAGKDRRFAEKFVQKATE